MDHIKVLRELCGVTAFREFGEPDSGAAMVQRGEYFKEILEHCHEQDEEGLEGIRSKISLKTTH